MGKRSSSRSPYGPPEIISEPFDVAAWQRVHADSGPALADDVVSMLVNGVMDARASVVRRASVVYRCGHRGCLHAAVFPFGEYGLLVSRLRGMFVDYRWDSDLGGEVPRGYRHPSECEEPPEVIVRGSSLIKARWIKSSKRLGYASCGYFCDHGSGSIPEVEVAGHMREAANMGKRQLVVTLW